MADVRSLQRKINRITLIENAIKGDLSKEPLEKIKAQSKLLSEEWNDYRAEEKDYDDGSDVVALQDTFETKYFAIKAKLIEAELKRENEEAQSNLDSSLQELISNQRSFINEVSNLNNKTESDVRLPRVNIPFFSGTYSEFASFRDLFDASINSNPKISKVHKPQYLKGLLRGEAAALVRHITITAANYDAWQMINQRYDKKKYVTTTLLKQFWISHLSLNHPLDPWLIHILLNKLDSTSKHDWAKHSFDIECPSIDDFFKFLNKQSETLESCEPTRRVSSRSTSNPHIKIAHADTQSITCLKCKLNHYLRNCEEFLRLPVTDRRKFVADNKLCFICLFKNHRSMDCRSKYRCTTCRARHHTTLHEDRQQTEANSSHLNVEFGMVNTNPEALQGSLEVQHVATS